jgi:hypothetical protein
MGANDDDINTMIFEALKTESPEYEHKLEDAKVMFEPKELPEDSKTLWEWACDPMSLTDDLRQNLIDTIQYVINRGFDPNSKQLYWSPAAGYNERVIIAFTYEGKIVGNTARKVTAGKPKYLSDQHPHFVFNVDAQQDENRYIFVCEGPFDALSIGGVALLTNDVADQQARIINGLGKQVIVIPDQDSAGLNLVKRAIDYGWAVAFPTWDDTVKDCADAVSKYGKLFVIVDAIKTAQQGEIKITMARKALETKIKRIEHVEGNN